MNKIKFCIFLLLICLSGCSAKTANNNIITSLNLEFDTFTSDDSVPITNVLLDEEEINEANWNNHPAIKEIREIYNTIEVSIKSNKLFITNGIKDTDSRFTKDFSIYKDKNQIVKKYIEESGSEDSGYTASYYFDDVNKLRFVFLELGATNGTNVEYRLYFDAQENKIWEHETLVKGPGYPFSDADEYLTILDPEKLFGSDIN
ncbi:hypothetical protein AN1V17_06960 [Vallitalea sediminicola]